MVEIRVWSEILEKGEGICVEIEAKFVKKYSN